MKALYQVTTKKRGERTIRESNWASYNVIAQSAVDAIKKATRKFTFAGEYATEVRLVGAVD